MTTIDKTPGPPGPMSAEEIERAARADRDAQPLTLADLGRMRRTPPAKIIRRALALTQEEFAARYHIPLGRCAIGSRVDQSLTSPRGPT